MWGGRGYVCYSEGVAVVEPSGRTEGDTRTGRTRKKPKDLSACESEERGSGGWGCVCYSDGVRCSIASQQGFSFFGRVSVFYWKKKTLSIPAINGIIVQLGIRGPGGVGEGRVSL